MLPASRQTMLCLSLWLCDLDGRAAEVRDIITNLKSIMKHLLCKYEAATLLPWSTHELLCNFRSREAKRAFFSPCAEGTLHRRESCFIFHAPWRASLKKALAFASAFFLAPRTGLEPVTSWLTVTRSTDWAIEEYMILSTQGGGN